ncbi:MAG: HlyC/CorC family transporter [Thiohalophilus sp.]
MNELPLGMLIGILIFLLIASGFFSGSETGLMSLNRYRLRNLAEKQHRGAQKAERLLNKPDRLIGVILLGNNFVNILASAIATLIGIRLFGETGILLATIALTIVVLIFSEVTPKTLAAFNPERYALPASYILSPLLWIFYPFVWLITRISNGLLRLFGIRLDEAGRMTLNSEELRVVVSEAGSMIPQRHQEMLLSILDLEKVSVEDIMIPRNEIAGIDISAEWDEIVKQLTESQHTRLPVYEGDIDHVIGMVHLRRTVGLFQQDELNKDRFRQIIRDAYFIPEATPLHTQLINFQRERRRIALVVNEYGDIQGLVTLEDILEEIVGEFTTDPAASNRDIHIQEDGTFLVDGSITIRELNKALQWDLPTEGPKTLNGLILEYLEHIPDPGTSLLIADYPIEIVQTTGSAVKTVHIDPSWKLGPTEPED